MQQLVETLPVAIREEVKQHLMVDCGWAKLTDCPVLYNKLVKNLPDGRRVGARFNVIHGFYENFTPNVGTAAQEPRN